MNKTTGFTFIGMAIYLFGMALLAIGNHAYTIINADVTKLNTIASLAFDAFIAGGLIVACASICVYIYKRINR